MEDKKNIIFTALAIVILALSGAGFYFFKQKSKGSKSEDNPNLVQSNEDKNQFEISEGTGEFNVDVSQAMKDPAESLPSANPYDSVKNPFKDAYKNPFKE